MARDDKRERLLAAAAAVFADRDFHQVQVSDVAERAGVGKGTVYLYFPTKDDLHRAALEASLEPIGIEVDAAVGGAAPADVTLRLIVLAVLRFFWKRQHLLTVIQRYEHGNGRRASYRRHRVLRAVERITERHPGQRVVVVTHGGSLRRIQAAVNGVADPVIDNCAVWTYQVEAEGRRS